MPNRKKRARLRRRSTGVLTALIIILILIAAAIIAMLIRSNPMQKDDSAQANAGYAQDLTFDAPVNSEAPMVIQNEDIQLIAEPTATPAPLITPTPEPEMQPADDAQTEQLNSLCPTAKPGDYYLPVFNRAERTPDDEMMIAITLDNCDRSTMMADYVRAAERYGIKLTLFPTGEALANESMKDSFATCVKSLGYEIENYVYSKRSPDYKLSNAELALQLWKQNITLSYILGADYEQHFYRPVNLSSADDQRTHYLLREMNLYGVGGYTYNYDGQTLERLMSTLQSGNIYRFDMSQKAYNLFLEFVDAATKKGYECVTMNRLFRLNENVLGGDLTLDQQVLPTFDGYVPTYYELKVNTRSYAVFALQRRLHALGYLKNPDAQTEYQADGLYGSQTSIAVSAFQARCGVPATGNADAETQERLFADDAPLSNY